MIQTNIQEIEIKDIAESPWQGRLLSTDDTENTATHIEELVSKFIHGNVD